MGAFQRLIGRLNDDELARIEHTDMGVMGLSDQVELLRLIRRELEAAEGLTYPEIPASVHSTVLSGDFDGELENLLNVMLNYGPSAANPAEARKGITAAIENLRDLIIERVRPIVRPEPPMADNLDARLALVEAESKMRAAAEQYDALVQQLQSDHEELSLQRASLSVDSAETVAADLSPHYRDQATDHGEAARRMLIASVVLGLLFAIATALALFVFPPDYTSDGTSEQWIEFVRGTVGRVTLLSLFALALAFCLRNYRVNRHLEVVNRKRENALNTFGLLQGAVTTDDARNVVVAELVRSVFGSEETGYLSGQPDRTVIESPGGAGILTAMTAPRGG